jgi:hypothetical protein
MLHLIWVLASLASPWAPPYLHVFDTEGDVITVVGVPDAGMNVFEHALSRIEIGGTGCYYVA